MPRRPGSEVRRAVGRWKVCKWKLASSEQGASLRLVSKDEMIRQPQQAQAVACGVRVCAECCPLGSIFPPNSADTRVRGQVTGRLVPIPAVFHVPQIPRCQSGRFCDRGQV